MRSVMPSKCLSAGKYYKWIFSSSRIIYEFFNVRIFRCKWSIGTKVMQNGQDSNGEWLEEFSNSMKYPCTVYSLVVDISYQYRTLPSFCLNYRRKSTLWLEFYRICVEITSVVNFKSRPNYYFSFDCLEFLAVQFPFDENIPLLLTKIY